MWSEERKLQCIFWFILIIVFSYVVASVLTVLARKDTPDWEVSHEGKCGNIIQHHEREDRER